MATTYLSRTFGTPTSASKFTISVWVKRDGFGSWKTILSSYVSGTRYTNFSFNGADQFAWHILDSSEVSKLYSNAKYRDVNGWYHLVFNWDSTQATASDRTKLWVNGVQITSWNTQTNSAQNTNYEMNTAVTHYIGAEKGNTGGSFGNYFNGSMSHFHFADGTAYPASTFGETDATTGEWKIIAAPSFTLGNNGFTILKDGNTITDQSSNSNNWTLGAGTLTNTEDSPSNVFATMNPLSSYYFGGTFSNGNTKIVTDNSNESYATSTLGVSSGKYYWEVKDLATQDYEFIGISDRIASATSYSAWSDANGSVAYYSRNGDYRKGSDGSNTSYGNTYGENDIVGIALDADNMKLYFSKNGTWQNSGDPTSGATGTGAISLNTPILNDGVLYAVAGDIYTGNSTFAFNFGNGYFATTAITSEGTNASNIGKFEYDVPTGFTALSTKGFNE